MNDIKRLEHLAFLEIVSCLYMSNGTANVAKGCNCLNA